MTARIFSRLFFALGFGCMVLPFFGSSLIVLLALLVGLALFLFADIPEEKRIFELTYSDLGFILLAAILLMELAVTFATTHFYRFGPPTLTEQGTVFRFMHAWREIADQRSFFLHQISGVFIGFMVSRFGRRSHFIGFLRGLAWGSLLAAAVCLCQVVGFLPEIFDNRGAFWMMVKRYQGTLTDPNAFGMMAAIAAPLLIGLGIRRRRLWYYLAAMAVMTMGLWSGSRSFFLMLGLTAVLAGWAFRRTLSGGSPGSRRMMFGAVLLSGVVFVAALKSNSLPVGVQRLFATVDSSLSGEMLSSRAIYTKLALNVWSETSPVFGAGLGMFYRLQNAAADAVGINLKGWADNANNFYLQLLAEGGLAAVAMFIAAVLMFIRARSIDTSLVAVLLFALLLVLITGPHTNFNEVLVVFSVLLGFFVTLKPMRQSFFNRGSRWVAVLLMVVVVAGAFALSGGSSYGGSYGLYAPEGRGADRFRWSYARANVALDRNCQDKTLRLGSMKPDVATSPQRVRIREYGVNGQLMQEQSLRLGDHGEYLLEFGSEIRSVSLEVTPVWRPFDYGNPGDKRILGITLKGPTFKSCAD